MTAERGQPYIIFLCCVWFGLISFQMGKSNLNWLSTRRHNMYMGCACRNVFGWDGYLYYICACWKNGHQNIIIIIAAHSPSGNTIQDLCCVCVGLPQTKVKWPRRRNGKNAMSWTRRTNAEHSPLTLRLDQTRNGWSRAALEQVMGCALPHSRDLNTHEARAGTWWQALNPVFAYVVYFWFRAITRARTSIIEPSQIYARKTVDIGRWDCALRIGVRDGDRAPLYWRVWGGDSWGRWADSTWKWFDNSETRFGTGRYI